MATTKTKKTTEKTSKAKKAPKKKATKKEVLIDEAKALGLMVPEEATEKQLKALIQTEKLKADLPAPPPPPPSMESKKLKNKDTIISIGPGEGARLLQGLVEEDDEDKWKTLSIISPKGAPQIRIKATQEIKKVRLLQGSESGPELESMKL